MTPQQWKRPPLPEETFTDRFGEGEGELLTLSYPGHCRCGWTVGW